MLKKKITQIGEHDVEYGKNCIRAFSMQGPNRFRPP